MHAPDLKRYTLQISGRQMNQATEKPYLSCTEHCGTITDPYVLSFIDL